MYPLCCHHFDWFLNENGIYQLWLNKVPLRQRFLFRYGAVSAQDWRLRFRGVTASVAGLQLHLAAAFNACKVTSPSPELLFSSRMMRLLPVVLLIGVQSQSESESECALLQITQQEDNPPSSKAQEVISQHFEGVARFLFRNSV